MKLLINRYSFLLAILSFTAEFAVAQDTAAQVTNKKFVTPVVTVAVLPLRYTGEGSHDWREEMPFRLQELVIGYMGNLDNGWQIQDASQTNALLYKHGITPANIRQYNTKELAQIMHVQYLITGSVTQEPGSIRTVTHRRSENERRRREDNHDRSRERRHSHESSATVQNFHTDVSVVIYDVHGERIFSQSRRSILSDVDAYKAALRYIVKRSPLYSKYN